MAWIGSDDMYHPNAFFSVAQVFSECPRVSWLVGAQASYDEKDRTVWVDSSPYFNHLGFLMHHFQWVQQESTFWHRNLYERVGGIGTEYKLAGDFDLWMRFSRHEKMFVTNALIGGFRHSEVQLSKNIELYFSEVDTIIAKEKISADELREIRLIKRKRRIVSLVKKLKLFNWHALNGWLMRRYVREEYEQRIFFDFDRKRFVVSE